MAPARGFLSIVRLTVFFVGGRGIDFVPLLARLPSFWNRNYLPICCAGSRLRSEAVALKRNDLLGAA